MSAPSYSVGIDLGTTFTAAAVHRNGRTDICRLGNRAASIPSLVFLRDDQAILTGDAAERRGLTEPTRLAREFKRRVGDSAPIMLGQAPYSAERLMAVLLRQVVAAIGTREGAPPERVVVSHPANWGPFKIDLLDHAMDLAGLRSVALLTEPVAAAIHYASTERVEAGSVVAVYDLGGGTFDAAVLKKADAGFATLGKPEGIERLGGIDFDEAVLAYVRSQLDGKLEELDGRDPSVRAALGRLRQECVAAKEALSFDSDTAISVLLPNLQTEVRMTRAEFEPMIRAAIAETIEALQRTIERSGIRPDDLASVLLVGGSSQIPLVAELVSNALGRPVAVDAHPKHSIALGAAMAATALVGAGAGFGAGHGPGCGSVAAGNGGGPPPGSPAPPSPAPLPGSPPPGSSAPPPEPGVSPGRPPGPPPTGAETETSPRRWGVVAAAVGVVVAVILGAYWLGSNAGGSEEPRSAPPDTTESTESTDPPADSTTPPAVTDCASQSGRCVGITDVRLEGDRFVADYEAADFDPLIFVPGEQGTPEDHHVHFFFDTTAPENAGTNGDPPGDWFIWDRTKGGGELRFDDATVADAGDAQQLCVAVADSDHAVEAASGNCVDLPRSDAGGG